MISTNDIKPGMALNLPEGLFQVVDYQHVKPGKGKAFVRMKLKNLTSGAVIDRTFRADEKVPRATIDRRDFQFLYRDDMGFHFMDGATYEQIALSSDAVGEEASVSRRRRNRAIVDVRRQADQDRSFRPPSSWRSPTPSPASRATAYRGQRSR